MHMPSQNDVNAYERSQTGAAHHCFLLAREAIAFDGGVQEQDADSRPRKQVFWIAESERVEGISTGGRSRIATQANQGDANAGNVERDRPQRMLACDVMEAIELAVYGLWSYAAETGALAWCVVVTADRVNSDASCSQPRKLSRYEGAVPVARLDRIKEVARVEEQMRTSGDSALHCSEESFLQALATLGLSSRTQPRQGCGQVVVSSKHHADYSLVGRFRFLSMRRIYQRCSPVIDPSTPWGMNQ